MVGRSYVLVLSNLDLVSEMKLIKDMQNIPNPAPP